MAFKGLLITETGKAILAQAHLGSGLCITKVMIGDGTVLKNHENVESMVNALYSKNPVLHRDGDKVFIDVDITSNDMSGYYFREIGIYAKDSANKEVLFAYDNAGDDAEYIAPVDSNIAYEKRLHFVFVISNDIQVTISTAGTIYALQDDLETLDQNKLDKTGSASQTTVTYLVADARDNIKSGETLSIILGKIAKWFGDFKNIVWTGSYNDLVDVPDTFPPSSHTHDQLHTHSNKEALDKIDQGMLDTILYYTDSEVTE